MKNEAEFCNVVKKSMICSYKIPDPSGVYANTIKRSFDGIGMLLINDELKFVCWEAKFLKKPQAFNFNRIEKHQSFYIIIVRRFDYDRYCRQKSRSIEEYS